MSTSRSKVHWPAVALLITCLAGLATILVLNPGWWKDPPAKVRTELIAEPQETQALTEAGKSAVWAIRVNPDGQRQRWKITGGVNGPPYGVQLEHAALPGANSPGVIEVWVEGDRLFIHSGNAHELQPRWRSSNFLEIVLVDDDDTYADHRTAQLQTAKAQVIAAVEEATFTIDSDLYRKIEEAFAELEDPAQP